MGEVERILQVLGSLEIGGAEVMIMNLYRHTDHARVQFDFIIHTPQPCFFETEIAKLGGRVYRLPRFTGFNILHYARAWKQFFREHPEYHVIHGHVASSSAIYLGIAKRFHVYTIAHSHSVKMFHGIKGVMDRLFSYPTRWIADQFFACSRSAGIARFGRGVVASSKFKIITNALEVEKLAYNPGIRDAYRTQLGLEGRFVVGHVGRFDLIKNHEFLINLFSSLHDRYPASILVLVGDGQQRPAIDSLIKKLSLIDSVKILGMRSDVVELLQAMDVFVFPSLAEGLGISVIEAQATGLPCIVSTCVPQDVKLTELVEFVDLKEPMDVWIESIMRKRTGSDRTSHIESLAAHGYGVTKVAEYIQTFYLDAAKRDTRVGR